MKYTIWYINHNRDVFNEYLGNSIERIALEKAMIMRPETPLIVASQPAAAKNIIKILAADQKISAIALQLFFLCCI